MALVSWDAAAFGAFIALVGKADPHGERTGKSFPFWQDFVQHGGAEGVGQAFRSDQQLLLGCLRLGRLLGVELTGAIIVSAWRHEP